MKENIFITGITGFIGTQLARRLLSSGYRVCGSSTSTPTPQANPAYPIFRLKFGERFDPEVFRGIDVLVHTAYCVGSKQKELNIEGTKSLSLAAKKMGVQFEIYLSSCSALTGATSDYAAVKISLENHFRAATSAAIVRPGLVIGRGGLFGRMMALTERCPIIPLLDGGRKTIPLVASSDLTRSLEIILQNKMVGEFNLIATRAHTLFALMDEFRRQTRLRTIFVPVPAKAALRFVQFLERAGIRLPVQAENISGFNAGQGANIPSQLKTLIGAELDLRAMISEVIDR
jgi:nucleoside-diphosphate-sugar epimerase